MSGAACIGAGRQFRQLAELHLEIRTAATADANGGAVRPSDRGI
jgi:hypothetical protein